MFAWTPSKYLRGEKDNANTNHSIEQFLAPVVHLEIGETITSYKKLVNGPVMSET